MPWKQIAGGLSRISAGSVTNVWGVNSSANVFRYTGDDSDPWVQIPGALTDIGAAADGTVWGVSGSGEIFRYTWDSTHWIKIPGTLKRISAGSRTNVWGVNAAGNVFRYTGDDSKPGSPSLETSPTSARVLTARFGASIPRATSFATLGTKGIPITGFKFLVASVRSRPG